jgi:hypothetical protein
LKLVFFGGSCSKANQYLLIDIGSPFNVQEEIGLNEFDGSFSS